METNNNHSVGRVGENEREREKRMYVEAMPLMEKEAMYTRRRAWS